MWEQARHRARAQPQGKQRQDSGETPTSAATELTYASPDGNSNTSSCLTQIPLLYPYAWPLLQEALQNCTRGVLPSSWLCFNPTPASRCLTSSHSRTLGVSKGEARPDTLPQHCGAWGWEWPRRSPLLSHWLIPPVGGTRAGGGPGLEGPDAGTWAQNPPI